MKRVRQVFLILILLTAACTPTQIPTSTVQEAKPGATSAPNQDPFAKELEQMVQNTIQERGVSNPDVLRAMRTVPRHLFVPADMVNQAYDDHPLPIGYGQTISQPYVVAWMTEQLALKPGDKVLEIGTGSGYQAAVLAELGGIDVYSIEIVPALAESATKRLKDLGYSQVKV